MFSTHSLADILCPQMPSAVTSVNRDVRSEINASVGSLGKVKAGEVGTKTEVVAKNLFDKYPNVDRLLALQTMSATYCSMLRESALREGEKIDRWEKFQEKVLNLQPSPQSPSTTIPPKRSKIPGAIQGRWVIQETENTPKTYLNFRSWNGRLTGNTQILYPWTSFQKTGILEGEVSGNHITFVTKRYYPGLNTLERFIHHYEGQIEGNKINFTVQLEGGAFEEVIARKLVRAKRPSDNPFGWVDGEVTYRARKKNSLFDYETFQTAKEACLDVFQEHYGEEKNKGWEDVRAEEIGTQVRCIAKYADGRSDVYTTYDFIDVLLACPKNSATNYQKDTGERRCKCDDEYLAKNGECAPLSGE